MAGPAFVEVAVAQAEPRGRAVLALREAVDDPLEVLPRASRTAASPAPSGRASQMHLVGVAGEGRDVGAAARAGAAPADDASAQQEAASSSHRPWIQSHSRRETLRSGRPSDRKPRSRRRRARVREGVPHVALLGLFADDLQPAARDLLDRPQHVMEGSRSPPPDVVDAPGPSGVAARRGWPPRCRRRR